MLPVFSTFRSNPIIKSAQKIPWPVANAIAQCALYCDAKSSASKSMIETDALFLALPRVSQPAAALQPGCEEMEKE